LRLKISLLRKPMPRAGKKVKSKNSKVKIGTSFNLESSQFQSFQPFNRFAPFKALRRFKVQGSRVQRTSNSIGTSKSQELTEARSAALFALAFRGKKTFRTVCAQLYDHFEPRSSFDQRHRAECHR
jgi:hypothetical protein